MWEDEGPDCVVGGGSEEAGSVGGPCGVLVWGFSGGEMGKGNLPLCAFEVIDL